MIVSRSSGSPPACPTVMVTGALTVTAPWLSTARALSTYWPLAGGVQLSTYGAAALLPSCTSPAWKVTRLTEPSASLALACRLRASPARTL